LGTDPLALDTDGDVLTDVEEVTAGSNPLVIDTDGDQISDYLELKTYATKVAEQDSDGDSLSDGDEITRLETDPLKSDTDGGGALDGLEVARGANPLDASDDPGLIALPPPPDSSKAIYIYGVIFGRNGEIQRGSETALENAFISIVLMGDVDIDVISHTDNTGSTRDNDRVSDLRARSVVKWFVDRGIKAKRLRPVGMGDREPIVPNDTEAGRAKNRRIELRIRR
jgi:outer membrane protein OmpA-like peptidoglycan-associated protein